MAPAASITDVCRNRASHGALVVGLAQVTPAANAREPTDGTHANKHSPPRAELPISPVPAVPQGVSPSREAHAQSLPTHTHEDHTLNIHTQTTACART